MIELPEFMSGAVVERTYRRMRELQDRAREPFWNGGMRARAFRDRGMRMARARDPRMLLFLEKGAEYLRARNDEQASRFAQEGYARTDFGEYALWREAFLKATEPQQHDDVMYGLYGWVYAAVAEALA